ELTRLLSRSLTRPRRILPCAHLPSSSSSPFWPSHHPRSHHLLCSTTPCLLIIYLYCDAVFTLLIYIKYYFIVCLLLHPVPFRCDHSRITLYQSWLHFSSGVGRVSGNSHKIQRYQVLDEVCPLTSKLLKCYIRDGATDDNKN